MPDTNETEQNMISTDATIEENVESILSPMRRTDFEVLSDFWLDDVARYDFTECRYALEPKYKKSALWIKLLPQDANLPGEAVSTAINFEEDGINSGEYLWFTNRLVSAVLNGIRRCFSMADIFGSYNQETDELSYGQTGVFGTSTDLANYVYSGLSSGLEADLVEAFFYFATSLSLSAQSSLSREAFFMTLEEFFTAPVQEVNPGEAAWKHQQFYRSLYNGILSSTEYWMEQALTLWQDATNLLVETYGLKSLQAALDEFLYEPEPLQPYSFDPFLSYTYNLGLRLVYRQEWRPLGNQRGEIVKVIPLGPKQAEKISTKITRRTKVSRMAEALRSTETTTETTDTTKDSTEVVNEAATTHNWEIKADGSFNVSFAGIGFGGSVQGPSYGGSTTDKTIETSSELNELVQKTANKITTETKVTVSRESEYTYEDTTASEIYNPNEEIAVTYVYSKLQRQYEVFTSLAEVQNVVMVAEEIPEPREVDFNWVKKYDWIIAKVLLDDSFRDALNSISQEIQSPGQSIMTEDMKGVMDSTIDHLGSLTTTNRGSDLSLSGIDVVEESQRNYREVVKERIESLKENYRLKQKRERLYQHIRANILHYCRAIWSHEDPQQRVMRYRKRGIKIHVNWGFITPPGSSGLSIYCSIESLLVSGQPDAQGNVTFDLDGEFWHSDEWVDLADLINPAGPIDYIGNYALYYIRPEMAGTDVLGMLHILKAPYLYYAPQKDDGGNIIGYDAPVLMDPLLKRYTQDGAPVPISENIKEEMAHLIPDLRMLYEDAKRRNREPLSDDDKSALANFWSNEELFRRFYPEYRFRQDQSNLLLLNTNNVIIDIEVGTGTTLETFKLTHRGIDVLKAREEKRKLELENLRRKTLIEKGKLGDPEVEKITYVKSDEGDADTYVIGTDD